MMRRAHHGYALRGSRPLAAPLDGRAPFVLAGAGFANRRLLATAVVFVLCAAGLCVLHQQTRPHYRLSAAAAIAAARANPEDRAFLAHHQADSARVIPLDATTQRVTFFDGPRVVLDAAVGARGEVVAAEEHVAGTPASGAALANAPWVLVLLSALFLLATLVVPLRRMRNLDALALAEPHAHRAADQRGPGRRQCALRRAATLLPAGQVPVGRPGLGGRGVSPGTPLLDRLWAGWEPRQRTRMLRLILLATILAFLAITLTSSGYTDVAVASLQGATDVLHGVLPYGHVSLAFHGDTYPLLNYLLYVPAALWWPVSSAFSDFSGSLVTAAVASLLAGWALYRVAASRELGEGDASSADRRLRAALAWFAFPPVLLAASGGANDLVLAACLAWMLALRTRAGASLVALAAGVWVKLVPLILVAIWLPYRRRGLGGACAGALALSVALTGLLLLLGGAHGLAAMVHAMAFQFQRGSFYAPWYTFHLQWLQPFAQAAVLAVLVAAVLRLRADPSTRTDPVRLSALAAALLLGVQLAANYWTWSYSPWVFPFLAVGLLLAQREAAPSASEGALATLSG